MDDVQNEWPREDRELQGQIDQLSDLLNIEWVICPRNFSAYTDEQREKHCWGHGYCGDGILKEDYNHRSICAECKGAGKVIKA